MSGRVACEPADHVRAHTPDEAPRLTAVRQQFQRIVELNLECQTLRAELAKAKATIAELEGRIRFSLLL